MFCNQVLNTIIEKSNGSRGSKYYATPQNSATIGGRVFLLEHGSGLPGDQRVQLLCWNDRPPPDANSAQATSRDVIVDRGPAKAGRSAGFPNAVTDLRGIVL